MKLYVFVYLFVFLYTSCSEVEQQKTAAVSEVVPSKNKTLPEKEVINSPSIIAEISAPAGYQRTNAATTSFAHFLRQLPLKPANSPVLLYNGELKGNQTAHYAVINLPIGKRDLHQCADAVMRLKAEYHFQRKDYANIHFN